MIAAKYHAFRKKVIDHLLGITPYAAPANVKLRLFTSAPSAAGGDGTPVSGNDYADVTIAWDGSYVGAATSGGVATSTAIVNFGFANGGDWGTITAVDIRNAADDSLMWFATLETPVAVTDGQGFAFNTGDLVWSES